MHELALYTNGGFMRTDAAPLGWGWTLRAGVGLVGLALALTTSNSALRAQAGSVGQWATLPYLMPINPVHSALMNNGKVLIVSGSGNVAAETNFRYAVLDLQSERVDITLVAAVGHVLQRHGGPLGRPRVRQRRQPAVRPVPRSAEERSLRSRDRCLYRSPEHGARPVVSDGHHARRRTRDDVFGTG